VWRAIERAWRDGAALAGCSAGAMALTAHVPDLRHPLRGAEPGLGAVPHLRVLPHFDRFAGRLPDLLLTRLVDTPDGVTVVGVDEDTALLSASGDLSSWEVVGRSSVWVLTADGRTEHPAGTALST
jgi:cyanophycinase-like exopeptidase